MNQMVFKFVAEYIAVSGIPVDPRIEKELVARMAEAILAVIGAEGERKDEQPRTQS